MRSNICISIAAAAATLVLGVASVASAQAMNETAASVTIRVAGVDLSSPAGAKVALHRIETAADSVCGPRPDPRDLNRTAYDQCRKAAVTDAVASLDSPFVTQLASARTPSTQAPPMLVASR